ncbi:hypothetical protein OG21DRAFT_1493826 [Imleria badia]|nr:hypothetical protein OG21DRAFT_1493826 [Imleria badia]
MMLSNFIRRRKGNKGIEPRCHQKSFSASDSSQVVSPLVIDINDESPPLDAQNSSLVDITFSEHNEEWFPKELLRRSRSPQSSSSRAQNATITPDNLTQETHTNPSPVPSLSHSENLSYVAFRKKSIPAPIMIPGVDFLMPKVQIGHSAVPASVPQPNVQNGVALNSPSPVSENLSSISGTTLARALIGSSFVLSSCERRGSRRRSGVARQDSATLPRASFFLSDSGSSSPIPPVPPVPAMLVNAPPDPNCPSAIKSGASTDSEYPLSESYSTSPEMAINSAIPRRISCIQEIPSPAVPASTTAPLPSAPDTRPQRVPARARVPKKGVFDVPNTAVEASLPINSQEKIQYSSQEGSFLLSSDEHTLDEFDFVPPEPLVAVASPESDWSASYNASVAPLPRRSDTSRGQRKRRVGGSSFVRNGCMIGSFSHSKFESENFFTAKDNFMADGSFSYQGRGMPSATTSEHDYGELLNYDLTLSPESSMSWSSVSAGYQTFPETPVVFSPLWSAGYPFLAKSDSQVVRRRLSSVRSAGHGPGKVHSSMKMARRQAAKRRSQSSLLPREKTPSLKEAESSPSPSVPANDDASPDETSQSPTTNKVESQDSVEPVSDDRPHPLAHISSSSSYLQEEALRALAQHSPSSLPSIIVRDDDPSSDPTTAPVSITLPTFIPLPESPDVSPFNSPAFADSSTAFSSSASPLQSSTSTTSTAISQSLSLKFSHPSPSLEGSSFLPSPSPSTSSDEPHPRLHSPMAAISSSVVSDDLLSPSPSFFPPPPYHAIASERTSHHPSSTCTPSLSRTPSTGPSYLRSRQASNSSVTSVSARTRVRSRPPLPIGPRKPSIPGQVFGSHVPGIWARNGSASSVGSSDPTNGSALPWRKLHSAASQPPPKFQEPPPKWRGLTLEAAQWTFTPTQLQEIVSQAIQQSSEGSSLRFLRPEVLDGEIADEMHRLELQHINVKAQYKALVRKRLQLMGALAGHVEGVENDVVRTVEDLAEVLSDLDRLADKINDTVLQMAQLKSLRDVHNTSALALAVRKINGLFVRQMAEKERLQEEVDTLRTERDEAWKHAEDIAQDYDTLNDRVSESACGCGDTNVNASANAGAKSNADAASATGSKRSTRISAVRKSSIRQSQAGLRSRCRHRRGRSSSNVTRPTSLALDDIPPVPRLPLNPSIASSTLPLTTGISFGSAYASTQTSAALALAEAQREVYEMLGLSVPPSQASSRRRTLSGPDVSSPNSARPVSESLDVRRRRSRPECGRATRSVILDDVRL